MNTTRSFSEKDRLVSLAIVKCSRDKAVLHAIYAAGPNATIKTLAGLACCSSSSVDRALRALGQAGAITVRRRAGVYGLDAANEYSIRFDVLEKMAAGARPGGVQLGPPPVQLGPLPPQLGPPPVQVGPPFKTIHPSEPCAIPAPSNGAEARADSGWMDGRKGPTARAILDAAGVAGANLDALADAGLDPDVVMSEVRQVWSDPLVRNRVAVLVARLKARAGVKRPTRRRPDARSSEFAAAVERRRREIGL